MKIQKLTKAEEEIMQMIWDMGPTTVSGLIENMDSPKPPHSSISSIVRLLEKKGFVDHKAYGRTYEYFPLVDKKDYFRFSFRKLVGSYFDGGMNELVSFLVKEDDLSIEELSELTNKLSQNNSKRSS